MIHITKGHCRIPSLWPSNISQEEEEELFSKNTNHVNRIIFNEAKELEEVLSLIQNII